MACRFAQELVNLVGLAQLRLSLLRSLLTVLAFLITDAQSYL